MSYIMARPLEAASSAPALALEVGSPRAKPLRTRRLKTPEASPLAARALAADPSASEPANDAEPLRRLEAHLPPPTREEQTSSHARVETRSAPELTGPDPLEPVARRLAQEAEMWRDLLARSLARSAWADRVANVAAIGTWITSVAASVFGVLTMLLGLERSQGTTLLAVGSVVSAVASAAVVAWVAGGVRKAQSELAATSSARTADAERQLQRLGLVMALRREDRGLYRAAIAQVEASGLR